MPNLVGIGNSQVPTNAMLGGLAFQDSVGEINIEKIKARTSDTATDIFVYDTRKDSDGGAWRHRTQNTSWYNEGASETRGARKEFPAVAVIVAERNFITIYDGDDPNLSMWMVFNTLSPTGTSQGMGIGGGQQGRPMLQLQNVDKVVHMLNGILVTGTKNEGSNYGQPVINFINEKVLRMDSQAGEGGEWIGNIAQRNEALGYKSVDYDYVIRASYVFDIAMTVLPNARIDETTGLPIPTIAVATNGGVSVIRDDGTVIDHYDSAGSPSTQITFTQDGKIAFSHEGHTGIRIDSLKSADFNYGSNKVAKHNSEEFYINYGLISSGWSGNVPKLNEGAFSSRGQIVPVRDNILAENSNKGLNLLARDFPSSPDNNRVAYITSNYNTGWMQGDIKGAFLSDTDDTDLDRTNLMIFSGVDYGAFGSASGWTLSAAAAPTISGGKLVFDGTSGDGLAQRAETPAKVITGTSYTIQFTVSDYAAGTIRARTGNSPYGPTVSANGTYYHSFVAGGSPTETVLFYGSSFNGKVDDVKVYIEDQDRSVNNKGLQVFGTITKTPVATGAELVAYSGFSNSNYFSQPYNSDLNFGTGDLYIMFWANFTQNDAYDLIMARRAHNGSAYTGNGWYVEMGNDQNIQIKDSVGGTRAQIDADSVYNVWQHLCFVRRNNVGYGYKNGVLQSNTYAWNENLDNTSAVLTIGRGTISGSGDADKTRLALVRIGASAPTAEQIKKIYNDEKCLYHENAKCTLHGTSDDVIALASDDTNDILHVGTSSGRSEFQGLNRINNTTKAVTTAISASNGLVAEQ